MKLDTYVKTVLTVIAVALVAIAAQLWGERVSPSPAQAQTAAGDLESLTKRISALERTQNEQAQRMEALRSALQSTVTVAIGRGSYPDRTWSTIDWQPSAPPASGG